MSMQLCVCVSVEDFVMCLMTVDCGLMICDSGWHSFRTCAQDVEENVGHIYVMVMIDCDCVIYLTVFMDICIRVVL